MAEGEYMNSDSVFVKGYGHEVCEDYAYNTGDKVVISDGCSSADNTDIGSRLIARTSTAEEAMELVSKIGLNEETLTATRLSLELMEDKIIEDVEASVEFAENSPLPDPSELFKDVYVEDNYPFIMD